MQIIMSHAQIKAKYYRKQYIIVMYTTFIMVYAFMVFIECKVRVHKQHDNIIMALI